MKRELVTRSWRYFRRRFHFADLMQRTLYRFTAYGGGSFPWWRAHARLVTYGTAYLPRWAERGQ